MQLVPIVAHVLCFFSRSFGARKFVRMESFTRTYRMNIVVLVS